MADPSQKIVVVTGCSSGIGLATAILLAKMDNIRVIATIRNPKNDLWKTLQKKEALEKAAGETLNKSLFIRELDVSEEDSIMEFVKSTYQSEGRIDILINNAAGGQHGAFESVSLEQMHALFQTNVFGTCRLTQEVVKRMKERDAGGRIIFVSSVLGIVPFPYSDFYVGSKHALEGIAGSLAPVLKHFNIPVTIVEPGPVSTSFASNITKNKQGSSFPMGDEGAPPGMDERTAALRKTFLANYAGGDSRKSALQTGMDVAEVIKSTVLDENPPLRVQTSEAMIARAKSVLVDPTGEGINGYLTKLMEAKSDAPAEATPDTPSKI